LHIPYKEYLVTNLAREKRTSCLPGQVLKLVSQPLMQGFGTELLINPQSKGSHIFNSLLMVSVSPALFNDGFQVSIERVMLLHRVDAHPGATTLPFPDFHFVDPGFP
jgi:hypothetical protein